MKSKTPSYASEEVYYEVHDDGSVTVGLSQRGRSITDILIPKQTIQNLIYELPMFDGVKKVYEGAVENYVKEFCERYEMPYEPDMWVAGDVGTVICIADYYINFDDIRLMVDNDVPWDTYEKWYYYCLSLHSASNGSLHTPSLKSWIRGCPRMDEAKVKELEEKKREIEKMKIELMDMCNEYSRSY